VTCLGDGGGLGLDALLFGVVELELLLLGGHQLRLHLGHGRLSLGLQARLLLLALGRHLTRLLLHLAHHLLLGLELLLLLLGAQAGLLGLEGLPLSPLILL
jgi:hypothetical protein